MAEEQAGEEAEDGEVEGEAEGDDDVIALDDDEDAADEEEELDAEVADASFEIINEKDKHDGRHERLLLTRLRKGLTELLPEWRFELEAFGSYVTELGLPKEDSAGRSDLDVVLLFHDSNADSFDDRDVRPQVVDPTIEKLGTWLRRQPGVTVNNIIRKARVPIVIFDTKELSVDISVQQPWGVLNSWHLRDLAESGWPGRFRALARLVKHWAKSKSIHTAKDGALSSYGYSILAASFLMSCGGLPALLPKTSPATGPYMTSNKALQHVLSVCSTKNVRPKLWQRPMPLSTDCESSAAALACPEQLFKLFLEWMEATVLRFAGEAGSASRCGQVPLDQRFIASVRPRSQEELRVDVTWSQKKSEHWDPASSPVYLLIEEPLNGENVARCVKPEGFTAIQKEVRRGIQSLGPMGSRESAAKSFKALLKLSPLAANRTQPPGGFGSPTSWPRGAKRPWESPHPWTPNKRPMFVPNPATNYRPPLGVRPTFPRPQTPIKPITPLRPASVPALRVGRGMAAKTLPSFRPRAPAAPPATENADAEVLDE